MRTSKTLLAVGAVGVAAAVAASPFGCFYPDYTFDKNVSGGGGSSTQHGPGSGGTMSNTGGSGMTSSSTGQSNGGGGSSQGGGGGGTGGCTCVNAVPAGWTGYFALYDGNPGSDPGCPADYPSTTTPEYQGGRQLVVPPAECQPCGTTVSGGTCVAPATIHLSDASCGGTEHCSIDMGLGALNTCFDDGYLPGGQTTCGVNGGPMCMSGTAPCNVAISAPDATVNGGTCTATGGSVMSKPSTSFAKLGHACGDPTPETSSSCSPSQECLPNPGSQYAGICVMQTGDVSCPIGQFSDKHTFFENTKDDTRDCSMCTVSGPVAGRTCPATITVYSTNTTTCTGAPVATVQSGQCVALSGNPQVGDRKLTALGAPTGGSCPTDGGQPTGTVSPDVATTFCCVP